MNILIPTYKRANSLLGFDYFKGAKYIVAESQADDYLKTIPSSRMITIPDQYEGNLAVKRNWILDNFEKPLVMIDDDVRNMKILEGRCSSSKSLRYEKLEYDLLLILMERICSLCEELNIKFWGCSQKDDDREYKEFLPFSFTAFSLGPFSVHLDHPLRYDERLDSKHDYDMMIQQLHRYKKTLRVNFLAYWKYDRRDNPGGLVSRRTTEHEIKYCKRIMDKWGSNIIHYRIPPKKPTDLLQPLKLNVPIKGS